MHLPVLHLIPLGLGLGWAAVTDLRRRRVPNAVTGFVLLSGLVVTALDGGALAPLSGLAAFGLVLVALWRPWRVGGIGGGDVKLAAATAVWVGLGELLWFALATALAGGVVALVCFAVAGKAARADMKANLTLAVMRAELPEVPTHRTHVSVPYALAIVAGAVVVFFVV
jgi:prepilin peptidase CpaA